MGSKDAGRTQLVALTPKLSQQARRELGLSQAEVIKATGILTYKLKQWEARGLSIEQSTIRKLADFYESQGLDLAELVDHEQQRAAASGAGRGTELPEGFTFTPRPGFMISESLPARVVDKLMERMEANDDRVAALMTEAFETGFFGGVSDATEAKLKELIGSLAESHVIFRALQGRNIIGAIRDEPRTVGDYLAALMSESPALPLIAAPAAKTGGATQPATADAET